MVYNEGFVLIGSSLNQSHVAYALVVQDIRLYEVALTSSQVSELATSPVHSDVTPISGYIYYRSILFLISVFKIPILV